MIDPKEKAGTALGTMRGAVLATGVALLLAGCSGGETETAQTAAPATAQAAAPQVGVVTLSEQEVALTAEIAGRVMASQTAEIRPQVNGLITERVFVEGREVAAGDVLYRLDPKTFEAGVSSAEATLQRAEAGLSSARARFERLSNLSDSRVVSTAERDDAEAVFLQTQADVAVAQAALETARINLGYTSITAPIDGLIGTANVNAGSLVTANQADALATIRQLDPIFVDFSESSGNLLKFRTQAEKGAIRTQVGPDEVPEVRLTFADGTQYDEVGSIDFAEQFVSESTGSFIVRSRFQNPDRLLLPGMYVRGTVSLAVSDGGFLVPQRAVSRNADGEATAIFVTDDGQTETRVLTVSMDIGSNWLVTEGVQSGDKLVVDGFQRVRQGQAVAAVEVTIDANGVVQSADAAAAQARAEAEATNLSTTGVDQAGD